MSRPSSIRVRWALATLMLGAALAMPAAAELAAWDQAKVSALTAELEAARELARPSGSEVVEHGETAARLPEPHKDRVAID